MGKRSEEGGVVSRNKAKAELSQLEAEDPLPLRKSKITLEAARKRAEAARAPAEQALRNARAKVKEAEDFLEEIKKRPGQPYGALWWIDRELHERKAYIPESKGGYRPH